MFFHISHKNRFLRPFGALASRRWIWVISPCIPPHFDSIYLIWSRNPDEYTTGQTSMMDSSKPRKEYAMKRWIIKAIMLLTCCFLSFLSGCSNVSVETRQYLGIPTYPPTDPASVEILHSMPNIPIERIGEIILEPWGNPSKKDMEQKLKEAAAQLGANAAVIVSDRTRLMGGYVTGPRWNGEIIPEYGRVIIAVAIRYTKQG